MVAESLRKIVDRVLPPRYEHPPSPVQAAESAPSMILSADDEARPSKRLLKLALQAAQVASGGISLAARTGRFGVPPYFDTWPGEHYVLLAALMRVLRPGRVVVIGAGSWLDVLAIRDEVEAPARIVLLEQRDRELWRSDLEAADFVLLPGPGVLTSDREALMGWLVALRFRNAPILFCDGIRRWEMLRFWRNIRRPKLDVTSFGHWSGSGLVELAGSD